MPKLLLVEDDAITQLVFTMQLQACGCSVDLAKTGEQAIDKFLQGNYDFILMDIRLPDINGYEVTQQIRATEKGKIIPIIGITAFALFCVEEKCRAAGMTNVIEKPCTQETARRLITIYTG